MQQNSYWSKMLKKRFPFLPSSSSYRRRWGGETSSHLADIRADVVMLSVGIVDRLRLLPDVRPFDEHPSEEGDSVSEQDKLRVNVRSVRSDRVGDVVRFVSTARSDGGFDGSGQSLQSGLANATGLSSIEGFLQSLRPHMVGFPLAADGKLIDPLDRGVASSASLSEGV